MERQRSAGCKRDDARRNDCAGKINESGGVKPPDFMPEKVRQRAFPATRKAFDATANLVQDKWRKWAMGGTLPGVENIKNPSGRLAQSIKAGSEGAWTRNIGTNSPYMRRIQDGTKAFDMKETYPFGKKSRVTKSGKNKGGPYLIIPFRWGTPNSKGGARAHFPDFISTEIYQYVKGRGFVKSVRERETHFEKNYNGEEDIERPNYTWGGRLKGIGGNIEGMVRMQSDRGSTYFTFRIISAYSPESGWLRKAVPAKDVTGAVEKSTRYDVSAVIQNGFMTDIGMTGLT